MDLLELMAKRRSVRKFTDEPLSQEQLDRILDAGLLAPTSMNRRPCTFYAVTDKDTLAVISACKKAGGTFIKDAQAAIVVFGDEAKTDTWMEDTSIALSFMMLEAESIGISSCFVQIAFRKGQDGSDAEDNLRSLFHVPQSYRISGILALGKADQKPAPYDIAALDRSCIVKI